MGKLGSWMGKPFFQVKNGEKHTLNDFAKITASGLLTYFRPFRHAQKRCDVVMTVGDTHFHTLPDLNFIIGNCAHILQAEADGKAGKEVDRYIFRLFRDDSALDTNPLMRYNNLSSNNPLL